MRSAISCGLGKFSKVVHELSYMSASPFNVVHALKDYAFLKLMESKV